LPALLYAADAIDAVVDIFADAALRRRFCRYASLMLADALLRCHAMPPPCYATRQMLPPPPMFRRYDIADFASFLRRYWLSDAYR